MEKYEYKVITYDTKWILVSSVEVNQLENQLNVLGYDGWDLVSSFPQLKSVVHLKV